MTNIDPSCRTAIFVGFQNEWEDWSEVNSDGITFSLSSGVYLTGEVKIFSEDGDLQTIRRYKEGLLDGEMATYHPNGTQAQSVIYKEGKKHGQEIWWQDNGYKSYSANHVGGKLHGKTFNWDDKGYLISQSEFDMGNPMRPTEKVIAPPPRGAVKTGGYYLQFFQRRGNRVAPRKLRTTPTTEITVRRTDQVLSISFSVNPLSF